MAENFNRIMTCKKTGIVDDFTVFLLKNFGEKEFPGIHKAKIVFCDPSDQIPAKAAKEKTLFIGVGNGQFGEHAATRMARTLGVEHDPTLKMLLSYMHFIETGKPYDKTRIRPEERPHPFGLSTMAKLYHQQYPKSPKRVMDLVIAGIKAKHHEQTSFFNETKEEFERIAEIKEIQGPSKVIKLATVTSDNRQINQFARSKHGGNIAVIIQKGSSGHIHVFTNRYYRLILYDIVQMVRLAEQEAKKAKRIIRDWKMLASPGIMEGVEEWKFDTDKQMLLNTGGPTRLSLGIIEKIIKIGINPNAFNPKLAVQCQKDVCAPKAGGKCPWKPWGLQRCRKIRFKMQEQ